MRLLVYSLLRVLMLAAALGLGYLLGLRSWLLVLVAVVIATAASYLFLRGPRDAAVGELASGFAAPRGRRRPTADEEHEDLLDEQARHAENAEGMRRAAADAAPGIDERGGPGAVEGPGRPRTFDGPGGTGPTGTGSAGTGSTGTGSSGSEGQGETQ